VHVVATAGHVDHGKSTLVRALTGMEPDRWAEERRRGMTIDLGFAWTVLPTGQELAFVDVPGHARFVTNMLAGVGPAPAALFVVAADEGWMPQSTEHLDALRALGIRHAVLAVTRIDLADPAPALADATARLAGTTLDPAAAVAVSGRTGAGLPELTAALATLVDSLPPADTGAPVRLWVDRAFSIKGAGTVVTGTLPAGTLRRGDELHLLPEGRTVTVRALHRLNTPADEVPAVARVAVNLRRVEPEDIRRGDVLASPGTHQATDVADARVAATTERAALPGRLVAHIGSAAVPVRLRPLGADGTIIRLQLARRLPLRLGDRVLLRDPGRHEVVAAADILDVAPPPLTRRGAAARRAADLAPTVGRPDPADELRRRGVLFPAAFARWAGQWPPGPPATPLIDDARLTTWQARLTAATRDHLVRDPYSAGLPVAEAGRAIGVDHPDVVAAVVAATPDVVERDGRLRPAAQPAGDLPEQLATSLRPLLHRLAEAPFRAPEAADLASAGLTPAALAAAVRAGVLVRIGGGVYLTPDAPAEAVRRLAALKAPFTLSEARQILDTTRRVAVPLLEHLDRTGHTRRLDAQRRTVIAPRG
jgi:selenocysteine-specific elongation factor